MEPEGRPAVLGVRFGVNPNSSSLGVDVTYLLFGSAFAVAAAIVLGTFLRGARARVTRFGEPEQK